MSQRELVYEPDGATLEAFLAAEAVVEGIRGPYGSGKSTACVVKLLDRAMRQAPRADGVRPTRWAAIRNTYGELKTTTLKTFEQWVDGRFCQINRSARPIEAKMRFRLEDRTVVDSEWLFISLDRDEDVAKLRGIEITGAWMNEASELPRSVLTHLVGRRGRYPPMRDVEATWAGVVLDTNPPDTEHWWYELAEVNRPDGWAFFGQPPGDSDQAENASWLLPGYYDEMKRGMSPDEIRVFVQGQYGYVQQGRRVYPDYEDWLHCGDRVLEPNKDLELWVGLDFGWSAAAVIAQRDAQRRWDVLEELYSEDLTTQRFAELVAHKLRTDYRGHRIAGIRGDPSGLASSPLVSEDQPRTHMDICRAAGLDVHPAPTNDRKLRIEAVSRPLRRLAGGRPQLLISKRCVELRKGFNGRYRYPKRTYSGDEAYSEQPVKNRWSHPHDALQYILVSAGEAEEVLNIQQPKAPVIPPHKRYGAWMRRGR